MHARLAVDGQRLVELAAEADRAGVRVERQAEVDHLADVAFRCGEEPGHGLGVVPDVRAGARAAADALPAVEAAVAEPVGGRGGQDRRVERTCGRGTSRAASSRTRCRARAGSGRESLSKFAATYSATAWAEANRLPYLPAFDVRAASGAGCWGSARRRRRSPWPACPARARACGPARRPASGRAGLARRRATGPSRPARSRRASSGTMAADPLSASAGSQQRQAHRAEVRLVLQRRGAARPACR